MENKELKPAIAYFRVSTPRQKKSGLSLEDQQRMVREFAAQNGFQILNEYSETESGRDDHRPILLSAIAEARCTASTLIFPKVDRLARSVKFTATLLDSHVPLIFADMPSADRFLIHVRASIAEEESRMIRERVTRCLAQAKRNGVKLGSNRPGHWDGREHLRLEGLRKAREVSAKVRHQRAIERWESAFPLIHKLWTSGATLAEIGESLISTGIRPLRSKKWSPASVKKLLQLAKVPHRSTSNDDPF